MGFSDLPGAVGDPAPAHYGEPVREQRALAAGRAVAALGDRAVIEVAGSERLGWLDSITSQALKALRPGESTELLVLDPQGRVEHAAGVVDDGASAWLLADAGDAPGLAAWLGRMVFRADARVALRPELIVVGAVPGGAAESALGERALAPAGVPLVWHDPWEGVSAGGHQYAQVAAHPGAERPWIEVVVDAEASVALADAAARGELVAAGSDAADALRIAAWRPRAAREIDERSLPHEADWLRSAVHLNKGCYRGQETVAKVHNLGHPPRRLAFLHIDGELPEPGASVTDEAGAEVGTVTSSARHHELGPIALAILKRTTPVDAVLRVAVDGGVVAAAQEVIVPPGAGATAGVPRLPRLSARRA